MKSALKAYAITDTKLRMKNLLKNLCGQNRLYKQFYISLVVETTIKSFHLGRKISRIRELYVIKKE
jgi:hypothetical protein